MSTPAKVMGLKLNAPIRFIIDTAANWAASSYKLALNEFAIISDEPLHFKMGTGVSRTQKDGKTFAELPYIEMTGGTQPGPLLYSTTSGITAHSGGGQGSAVALTSEINNVTVVAALGDSVKLPVAQVGMAITVKNEGAEALAVFPATGAAINTLGANASVYISPGTSKTFRAQTTTLWQESTGPVVTSRIPAAINVSGTATAAQIGTGAITSTSAAAVALVFPTATLLAAYLGAVLGTTFDVIIDNTGGANTVTITLGAGMTQNGHGLLTVPAGEAVKFNFYFTGPTAAIVTRVVADKSATVAAMVDNSGGASGGNTIAVLVDAGGTAAGAPTTASVANALATLAAKQNAILTALKNANLMA